MLLLFFLQESIKPILYGSDDDAKTITSNILFTCLDVGLRLLHPIMPYVTEELFQRLPGENKKDKTSICVHPYPTTKEVSFLFLLTYFSHLLCEVLS